MNSVQSSPHPLSDVPPTVLKMDTWPLWRRMTMRPDDHARTRIQAWRELTRHASASTPEPKVKLPGARQPGIFDASIVYWDLLVGHSARGTTFHGMVTRQEKRVLRGSITNPHGPLVLTGTINDFTCDITDVEGITSSKSSEQHFETVDEFGRSYCDFLGTALTPGGLASMLSHNEIRISHRTSTDHFRLAIWDGRLILANDGGSHHFAGAAHIARAIGQAVPLTAQLNVSWLHEPAWKWLLARYRFVHSPAPRRLWSLMGAATLVGECFSIKLPSRLGDGELVLIPRAAPAHSALCDVLARHGAWDVSNELQVLLEAQASVKQSLARRWPQIFHLPDSSRASMTITMPLPMSCTSTPLA